MPSLQTALPPELANNVIRLYRECLRRAKYIGHQQHNTELLVNMVRQQFKRNKHETDPEKIQKLKDDAARGLINHILYESEKLSGRKVSKKNQLASTETSTLPSKTCSRKLKSTISKTLASFYST
uniref:Complex 1 LYR protein domain-containing protein n=1 Tax=Salix viminalis TaxID=40686 RepID=A0A6N2NB28_SALVM